MNRILSFYLLFLLTTSMFGQRDCGVAEILKQAKLQNPVAWEEFHQVKGYSSTYFRSEIVLPVVVHVVYSEEQYNISEFQILSQIDALNEAFSGKVKLSDDILDEHRNVIASPNIRFVLACTDPDGHSTNGITRTKTNIENIGTLFRDGQYAVHHTEDGGHDPWPTADYINVWAAETEPEFLGRSSLPMPLSDPFQDGVVISSRNFGYAGTANNRRPYHLGRTLVHEMGHYLGLNHPWGPGDGSCFTDDEVEDTPSQSEIYYDCPDETSSSSCETPDMTKNFMGYTDDPCLQYFTQGQVNRMMHFLSGFRATILDSYAATNCGLVTNPQETITFWNHIEAKEWIARFPTQQQNIHADLYNMKGQLVRSFDFQNTDLVHFHTDALPAALYVIRFSFDGKSEQRKVAVF